MQQFNREHVASVRDDKGLCMARRAIAQETHMPIRSKRTMFVATALSVAATATWAMEYGTVVSSTPIVAAVPVPQQECVDQPVAVQQPPTGVGALIGGIAGAALGNSMGSGAGRAAATGIGLIAGSAIGNQVEANGQPPVSSTVRQCHTVNRYENRTIGYDVEYEYQGVRRHTQLAQDPGERIALNVNVAPADAAAPPRSAVPPPPQGAYPPAPPPAVYPMPYGSAPYYPTPYYPAPYYVRPWPVFGVGIGYGWGWGGYGHRH
jgi:uncharacterized protein YcfJ